MSSHPARVRSAKVRGIALLLVSALLGTVPVTLLAPAAGAAEPGAIRITEWMYQGVGVSGGNPLNEHEFVELTNVGGAPVDLTGWRFHDSGRSFAAGFSLSGLGVVAPGESVVFADVTPALFRTEWGLSEDVKVVGPSAPGLGRGDEVNVYDAGGALVDRLTYGDNVAGVGGPRTQGASGWVSAAGLGANVATEWTLSTVGDAEGSWASAHGSVGSPGQSTHAPAPPEPGAIRITEWMYNMANDADGPGEFVELTNVGGQPVDLAGWRFRDSTGSFANGFDIGGFGVVAPGESVVLTEDTATSFRTVWGLCAATKVVGGSAPGLGRSDAIRIFDGSGAIVDQLTYGDQDIPGSIRTNGASGWVQPAGLGANNALLWTRSTVGDAEGSVLSSHPSPITKAIGSPGRSTRATVAFDPCPPVEPGDAPTVTADRGVVIGAVGDPAAPTLQLTLDDPDGDAEDLELTVGSSNGTVLPPANVSVTGDGTARTVTFTPAARGTSTVTFTVTDEDDQQGTATVTFAASAPAPDPTGRYHHGISDASAALDVGDGYVLLLNDETNTIFLHQQAVSGPPVKTWTFTPSQLGTGSEIDLEGIARSGDRLVLTGSHGNNRTGAPRPERRTLLAATITGTGAATEISFAGRYNGLWTDLRAWDAGDGHGLGANALGFVAGTASGVEPDPPAGFNIEGLSFAPDGETLYLGFRAPTIPVEGTGHALIVPVLNAADLLDGAPGTGPAELGAPILLDLGGRSIRALAGNEHGEYLISAGATPEEPTWALYTWDGDPAHAPVHNRALPAADLLTGGPWESIVAVPHPLVEGAVVRLVTDSGDTDFYGTGATKDLAPDFQKSYSQLFELGPVPGGGEEGDFLLTLLHSNDGESKLLPAGNVGGAGRFKALVDLLKAQAAAGDLPEGVTGRGTVTISSGDNFLAGPNFSASLSLPPGEPFYDARLIDLVGYDAMVLGNHEFDFGPDVLARFIEGVTDVPFLSSNLDVSAVPSLQALAEGGRIAPFTVVEKGGEQIGVIGATTEGLALISSPGDVVVNEVLPAVQAAVAALEGLGVDKIILASHLQDINNELALVAQLHGVDIVISGGGDELLANPATDPLHPGDLPVADYPRYVDDADGRSVPVVTTAGDYRYVGRLQVRFDADGELIEVLEPTSQPIGVSSAPGFPVPVTPDPTAVAEVEAPVAAYVAGLAANVVAHTEVPLDGRNPQPIRRYESNLGNLAADALLWKAAQRAGDVGAPLPDVALQNGGGIRNANVLGVGATPGSPQPLTELDTFNVMAFSNYVSVVPGITPQRLKELLEHSVAGVPAQGGTTGGGQWGHWAGLRFSWTRLGTAQVVSPTTNQVTTPGSRVLDVVLDDGTVLFERGVLAPTARDVNLATVDFTARGGDNYPFAGTTPINVAASYQQALADYLADEDGLDGLVTAADYPDLGQVVAPSLPRLADNPPHRRIVEARPRTTAGDFDGDGARDIAVFRPSTGRWYVRGQASVAFGQDGDVPVPGDYDGDGIVEEAVFRPSTGRWYLRGQASVAFSQDGDVPVPGDYDGDGVTDVAVFRPSTGRWYVRGLASVAFGQEGDIPVPGDYDGDGSTEVAVFRPSTGRWYVRGGASVAFGTEGDVPVPGDYDGDGTVDVAVFRPSTGRWYVQGLASVAYGTTGDVPVPGDYDGDGTTDIAVFRPTSAATWHVRGAGTVQFGTTGDVPVPRR